MPAEEFTGLTGWAAGVLERFAEPGLGLLVALENVFPPIPSEPVLTLAGVLAAQGRLSLLLILIAATLGSMLGALILYEGGARLGRARVARVVDRMPFLTLRDLERAEAWFARHGTKAVLIGRFMPVVRSLVSVPAGIERMPRGRFLLLTALGSGIWNATFVLLGRSLGEAVGLQTLGRVLDASLLVAAVGVVVVAVRRFVRRRRAAPRG